MKISLSKPLFIHELGKRSNQEDTYFLPDESVDLPAQFFMVCDGMGGHDKGEVASALVCQTMAAQLAAQLKEGRPFDDGVLNQALRQTYAALDQLPMEGKRPGTTFTFVCFHPSGVTTANIGDSRIYHLRPKERKILFQSRDHSLVFDLYLMGELKFEEMATSPQKNVITKALMPGIDSHHRPDIVHIADVQPGDCFLLCSDGLLEQTSNDQLVDLFARAKDLEEVRQLLVDASADNADNHTAVILQVADVEKTPGEALPDDEKSSPFNALNVRPISRGEDIPFTGAASASKASVPHASAPQSPNSGGAPRVAKPAASAKQGRPVKKGQSKKRPSPMLNIALAVLLVILVAVVGMLFLKKSPPTKAPEASPSAQVATVPPADSQAVANVPPADTSSTAAKSATTPTPPPPPPPSADKQPLSPSSPPVDNAVPSNAPKPDNATPSRSQKRDNLRDRTKN